ncbi:MAG: tetratricopeptide repeat protein [Chloroflexota bacterium]
MTALPTGTVTFLFTDIEGSTRLLDSQPDAYRRALGRHDEIIRRAVAEHDGVVVQSRGDGFCAAFSRPLAAIRAAVGSQQQLRQEDWGEAGQLKARMGIHTGEVELHGGEYFGVPLHRCARIMDCAHGGQVVLSSATAGLVGEALPPGVRLKDLGEHRLRDLLRPERIYQLAEDGDVVDFPPLRTLTAVPNNLPVQVTAFIGRGQQLQAVRTALLRTDARIVTLTGPGGTGKTRLALQAAVDLLHSFANGVYFVRLAPVTDPDLVLSAIAQVLDVRESAGRSLVAALADALRQKEILLLLDNFEQVVEAAPLLADLLNAAPRVKVLVTSRAVLHIYGERELSVPPLALPDHRTSPSAAHLSQFEAVRLFVDRAQAARSDFVLTDENAPDVAEICQRLDGLPLAIELAAARVRTLPPRALSQRLERRLPLLTGGARDLPARQRTLRDAIGWSYDLLTADEQTLFRRLAVFRGCTLDVAETVCAGDPPQAGRRTVALPPLDLDILDGVESLVEKSLLRQEEASDGQPRFRMLQTIREYALDRLDESGEADAIRRRHILAYLAFIESIEEELYGPEQAARFARVEEEHDNLRAALEWSEVGGYAQPAFRLAAGLWWFWSMRGHVEEGRARLESVLERFPLKAEASDARKGLHASASYSAGILASMQGDHRAARQRLEACLVLRREIGDRAGIFNALEGLGTVTGRQGDYAAARVFLQEALDISRLIDDFMPHALALHALGNVSAELGELDAARRYFEQSRSLVPPDDEHQGPSISLATIALAQGQLDEAEAIARSALTHYQRDGNRHVEALLLVMLGGVSLARDNLTEAWTRLSDGVAIMQELGRISGIAQTFERFVGLAMAQQRHAGAVQLAGSLTALLERAGAPLSPAATVRLEQMLTPAREGLPADEFTAAWEAGRASPLDHAVEAARRITAPAVSADPSTPSASPPLSPAAGPCPPVGRPASSPLSPRELEVAGQVARGLTNAEIARILVITEGTAANHVNHILTKLGFGSRAQIAAWATAHGYTTAEAPNGNHRA